MLAGRREALLLETAEQIRRASPETSVSHCVTDVGIAEQCVALIDETVAQFGRIDVLVNSAAVAESIAVLESTTDFWDRAFDINLRGSALCSIEAAKHMRDVGGGRIIFVSSVNSLISEPNSAPYTASKAGISSLARSFAVDLGDQRIAVNAVAPGWVDTPMSEPALKDVGPDDMWQLNPLGRPAHPDEIANLVVYLATEAPLFLTGTTILIDGGQTAAAAVPR